ncbi:MAG: thermosome subunit beta [Nitrososphaeria archaeon]
MGQPNSSGQSTKIAKDVPSSSSRINDLKKNITAAKLVAQLVRTTLGPRGMAKLVMDNLGNTTITNDGATILDKVDVQHPAAKAMVEVAKAVDKEVGDGTTTAVILAGALLEKAEELLDKKVHPNTIINGYREAERKAQEALKTMSIKINPKDKNWLLKVARTTLTKKVVPVYLDFLASLVVDSLLMVTTTSGDKLKVDIDDVRIVKKAGGSIENSQLIKGIILDKEISYYGMPKSIVDAKIALIWDHIDMKKTDLKYKYEINIDSPDSLRKYREEKEEVLKNMVEKVAKTGANVVFCKKPIDDIAQYYFAKAGIIAIQNLYPEDMLILEKATGAKIIKILDKLTPDHLGHAEMVEERKIWEGYPGEIFVEGYDNARGVTLLIRGGTQKLVEETERSIHDALCAVKGAMTKPIVVLGGGSLEIEIALNLFNYARTFHGKKQLAVQKFAEALETIPLTLAKNSGMDPTNALLELVTRHRKGEKNVGINALERKIEDTTKLEIYEPLVVKEEIFSIAVKATEMILKIDEDILAHRKPKPYRPPASTPQQVFSHIKRTYNKYESQFDTAEYPDINLNIA